MRNDFDSPVQFEGRRASSANIEASHRGHIDDVGILGAERDDLHRLLEPHDQRPNDCRAAQFLQHASRDGGRVEGWHDEHVRRVFQPAERIGGHQPLIERDVGAHFAVVLEVNPLGVEDPHRFLHAQRPFAGRMAEIGEGKHRHARLITEPSRHARRFDRNLGEILENLSGVIRQRFKMRRKIRALAAEGRASAMILSSLPIAMFFIIQLVVPDFYASVWDEPLTKTVLAIAGSWMGVGNLIMFRMVNFRI